jgi:hypothetical protein
VQVITFSATRCSSASAVLGQQHADNNPLRDDTCDLLVGTNNDQRANGTCRQQLNGER